MSQTESEPLPGAEARGDKPVLPRERSGFFRRVLDWYLCRPDLANARAAAKLSAREVELVSRAKAAVTAGNFLCEPSDPNRRLIAMAQAAALYADALYWALWAEQSERAQPSAEALWQSSPAIAKDAGLNPERAAEVAALLATPQLGIELAERTLEGQAAAATLLKRAALVAIEARERPLRRVDALTLASVARIFLTVLLFVALAGAIVTLRPDKPNLAANKPWRTSSSLFDCKPLQGECGGVKTRILFHTKDEPDPWVQYDLGARTQFSSMRIENRQDGETARAVPLVVEVSDDAVHFREVARRDDDFNTWKPSFPAQTARYVRLRVMRKSMLHLENVEVYR